MDDKASGIDQAVRRHCDNGGVGFLLQKIRRAAGAKPRPTAVGRKALKKVAGKAAQERAGTGPIGQRQRSRGTAGEARRAAAKQAALGLLASDLDTAAGFDEARLQARLRQMPAEELERLAGLRVAARSPADAGTRPALDRLGKMLGEKGFKLDVQGDNNAITISLGDSSNPPLEDRGGDGGLGYLNWGRQLGRVRHFLEGR